MKTQVLSVVISALFLFAVIGCSKEDTEAPVISLDDPTTVVLKVGQVYQEPGYTAIDNEDGDITDQVQVDLSELNTSTEGTYTIYYTSTDDAGNVSTAERTVIVYTLAGIWTVSEVCGSSSANYNDTITSDPDEIFFTRFANYWEADAYANYSVVGTGGTITIPSQSIVCGQPPQANRQFSGTGTLTISPGTITMVINYTELTNGTSTSCSATYTK